MTSDDGGYNAMQCLLCVSVNRINEKALTETQTLCAGYSKVEPKIFTLPLTPVPGVRDSQNLISWRWSLPLPTNRVW